MHDLKHLFDQNRAWAGAITGRDPEFFRRLVRQQSPTYLWIGCSDSRVPANEIVGLLPGELFVHRNVANVVVHSDLNCLSVIQYAVEVLCVQHIIVCGHYGCGGVKAALEGTGPGLIDNWLQHVRDVREKHAAVLAKELSSEACVDGLCRLNVIEQVRNVCQSTIVRSAWKRGQSLAVHGWIYAISDGLLQNLEISVTSPDALVERYATALARLRPR